MLINLMVRNAGDRFKSSRKKRWALLNEPELLIMDEPTLGLIPLFNKASLKLFGN